MRRFDVLVFGRGRYYLPTYCVLDVVSVSFGWLRSTVGGTPVFGRRTDPVLRSACSRRVITTGQPTRPTQPFILPGSINE